MFNHRKDYHPLGGVGLIAALAAGLWIDIQVCALIARLVWWHG